MDTRSLLSGALLVAGLVLAFAGCDGVGTSPDEIESDTTGTSAFRPSPKDSAAISDSLKRVAPGATLTVPIEAVANKPDSTGDCGGGLRFDSVSVSSSSLADASLHDGETEAKLEAAPDATGDVEMAFRPAYGECVSEETGTLPVTVKGDDVMPQISNATLKDLVNEDDTMTTGDDVEVSAAVTDEGSVSSVAVNEPGFKASVPADGSPVDKGQTASPGDQAGGRAAATGESIGVESVTAEVSAFDAGGGDGTVTLTDEDGDDTYEATFTVGEGATEGKPSATVTATEEARNEASAETNELTVEAGDETSPTIDSGEVASDNGHVDVSFSEGVYGNSDGSSPVEQDDFNLTFTQNDGAASGASITGVTKTNGDPLEGGEETIRVQINVEGSPASGEKAVEISPTDGSSIYDGAGNPAGADESTGALSLNDLKKPDFQPTQSDPEDDATGVSVGVSPELAFDEDVAAGSGTIDLVETGEGTVESFDVQQDAGTGEGEVDFSGRE
jgi:hypothetical protein